MGYDSNVLSNTQKETNRNQVVAGCWLFERFVYIAYILGAASIDLYKALRHTDNVPQQILQTLHASLGNLQRSFDLWLGQTIRGFGPHRLNHVLKYCRGFLAPKSRFVLRTGSLPLEKDCPLVCQVFCSVAYLSIILSCNLLVFVMCHCAVTVARK